MRRLYGLLDKLVASDVTVLVHGENGTGKELIARALHFSGPRRDKQFIAQNCSALNDQLLESELFGHVKGSFTGATRDKPGLFKVADGGTFFLDEVADMSPAMQVKLLRVLQEGTFVPVGATRPEKVDVRIIAASNKDLPEAVPRPEFREDLFYRGLGSNMATAVGALEKELIESGLRETRGNKSRLAERLGVSRTTLIKKIREYGISE